MHDQQKCADEKRENELDLRPLCVPHHPTRHWRECRNQHVKRKWNRLVGELNLVVPQSVKWEELARWGVAGCRKHYHHVG